MGIGYDDPNASWAPRQFAEKPAWMPQSIYDQVRASYDQIWSPYNQARMADEGSTLKGWEYGFDAGQLSDAERNAMGLQSGVYSNVDPFAADFGRSGWKMPRPEGFLDSGMGWMVPLGLAAGVAALGGGLGAAGAGEAAAGGTGLTMGAGGQTGLTLGAGGATGLTPAASTWAIPEWSAALGGLGGGLNLAQSGQGLKWSEIPNLSSMGGGQGMTLPMEGGTLTESGFIPAGGSIGGATQSLNLMDALRQINSISDLMGGGTGLTLGATGETGLTPGAGQTGLSPLPESQIAPEINPATIPMFGGGGYFSDAPYMMSPFFGTEGEAGAPEAGAATNEDVVAQAAGNEAAGMTPESSFYGSPMTPEGLAQRLWRVQGGGYPFFGQPKGQPDVANRVERVRRGKF